MSYPDPIFTDNANLSQIVDEITDKIVKNSLYSELTPEVIALREVSDKILIMMNHYIDLDMYPPGEPNTKAMRKGIVQSLSGENITNGSETTFP